MKGIEVDSSVTKNHDFGEITMSGKLKVALLMIISIIVLYLAVWSAIVTHLMSPMYEKMGRSFIEHQAVLHKDGYGYSIIKPNLFSFTGNMTISEDVSIGNAESAESVDLYIWVSPFDNYKFAVDIMYTTYAEEECAINSDAVTIYLDDKGELLNDDDVNKEAYLKHKQQILELYDLAYEMWGI